LFSDSKTVLSIYGAPDEKLGDSLAENLKFDGFNEDDLKLYENTHLNSIYKAGVHYVDGVLCASDKVDEDVKKYAAKNAANFVDISASENMADDVYKLYEQITIEEESVA
jgi:hypothetical protein